MKKYITLTICLITLFGRAGTLHLAWDPSPTPNVTYNVYSSTNEVSFIPVATGLSGLTCTVTNLATGRTQFVVSATKDGMESNYSGPITVESPAPPANLRVLILQYNDDATLTNWSDAMFFRLKIP